MKKQDSGCLKIFVRTVEAIGLILFLIVAVALYRSGRQEKDKIAKMTPAEKQAYAAQKAEQEASRETQRLHEQKEVEKEKWRKNEEEIKQRAAEIAERKAFAEKWEQMAEKEQMAYCDKKMECDLNKWKAEAENAAVNSILEKMHNPDSFKLVERTSQFVGYGRINVAVTFRGTNPFGGVVTNKKVIGYDFVFNPLKGEIECAKATLLD